MGASESTAKTNGAKEEEERPTDPMASVAAAAAGVAAVGMAAWGISRMLSDNTDSQQKQNAMTSNNSQLESMHESYSRRNIPRLSLAPLSNSGPFKMNTDGACRPNQSPGAYARDGSVMWGRSGYGGILRDNRGKWVRGFRGYIGLTDCLTAEFHGIHKGLQLLDKLGCVDSILESDNDAAVDWINNDSYRLRSPIIKDCWDIITECKHLKDKNRITVSSISRNDNKCADILASMAIVKEDPYVEIMNLPDEIKDKVVAEYPMFLTNY